MGLFKNTVDQVTVSTFVSHLEFAANQCMATQQVAWKHVSTAHEGMSKIRRKRIQTILTNEGWRYVIHLSTTIGMVAALEKVEPAFSQLQEITDQAVVWRDEAFAREMGE